LHCAAELLWQPEKFPQNAPLNRHPTAMFLSRILSAVTILAVAAASTGCMTNDRYQYSYKKRYKQTSIGRQAPQPEPQETATVTAPVPAMPPPVQTSAPVTELPPDSSGGTPELPPQ
jgi:hypothetical protein